ncbi:MAG: hypothetical protein ABIR71_02725 [Chthoniobacterales bacterium]
MSTGDATSEESTAKRKRWPIALLVAFLTALAGAALAIPVSDWAMQAHQVSSFEGERAYGVVCVFLPLAFLVGGSVGFWIGMALGGSGFTGYLKRQGVALAVIVALVLAVGGWSYAIANHPPLVDGKALALEIEARVPRIIARSQNWRRRVLIWHWS